MQLTHSTNHCSVLSKHSHCDHTVAVRSPCTSHVHCSHARAYAVAQIDIVRALQRDDDVQHCGESDILLDDVRVEPEPSPVQADVEEPIAVEVIRAEEDVKVPNRVHDDEEDEEEGRARQAAGQARKRSQSQCAENIQISLPTVTKSVRNAANICKKGWSSLPRLISLSCGTLPKTLPFAGQTNPRPDLARSPGM